MPRWLNALDVLVLPSLSTPSWTEQFGRVLIEGMCCGVPVIGSQSGEIPRVITEAGMTFPEGDIRALADAIKIVRTDRTRRDAMSALGRQRALKEFSQHRIAQATAQFYGRILA
jgi:glycosyltransferase involved in cell wall biosynthesis